MLTPKKTHSKDWPLGLFASYCLDNSRPALRAVIYPEGDQAVFQKLGTFQGKLVGLDVAFYCRMKHCGQAKIETLETLPQPSDDLFRPPREAMHAEEHAGISAKVMAGNRLGGENPDYPSVAKNDRVEGTVLLEAVIGRDGHVRDLKPISGPAELLLSAIRAVTTWRYKPYLLNGLPVDVKTEIHVEYRLSPRF